MQRPGVEWIGREMIGRREMPFDFQFHSRQPLIVQHVLGRAVAFDDDQLVVRGLERRFLVRPLYELSMHRRHG